MPSKKATTRTRVKTISQKAKKPKTQQMQGEGIIGDVWDWTKQKASDLNQYLKEKKLISQGLKMYSDIPGLPFGAEAGLASEFTERLGYGKKGKGMCGAGRSKFIS